jgi:hypothetical protein
VTTLSRTLPARLDIPEWGIPNFDGTEAAKGPWRAMWLFVRSTEEGKGASSGPSRLIDEERGKSGSFS